jgi:hypothetical protein
MHPEIDSLFNEAESRYLKSEELSIISQFVDSLPERLEAYRSLRDQELDIMQQVADQLQAQMPQEKVEDLERCIKNALLMLRYCAMGMLLNDENLIKERFLSWLSQTAQIYNTQSIDQVLYQLLNHQVSRTLNPKHVNLLNPMLTLAQNTILSKESIVV